MMKLTFIRVFINIWSQFLNQIAIERLPPNKKNSKVLKVNYKHFFTRFYEIQQIIPHTLLIPTLKFVVI